MSVLRNKFQNDKEIHWKEVYFKLQEQVVVISYSSKLYKLTTVCENLFASYLQQTAGKSYTSLQQVTVTISYRDKQHVGYMFPA